MQKCPRCHQKSAMKIPGTSLLSEVERFRIRCMMTGCCYDSGLMEKNFISGETKKVGFFKRIFG